MKRAAIISMCDVSGSIFEPMRSAAGREVLALETWLRARSPELASRFVIFDAIVHEVDREAFVSSKQTGGTMISAALVRCAEIVEADYAPADWDVFAALFTDGDNLSPEDTLKCIDLLRDRLLPRLVVFGLAQFRNPYGEGAFITDLGKHLGADPRVVSTFLTNEGDLVRTIQARVESLVPKEPQPRAAGARPSKARKRRAAKKSSRAR